MSMRARVAILTGGLALAATPGTAAAATLSSTGAPANAVEVAPKTALPTWPVGGFGAGVDTGGEATLWVDDQGTAHIAYFLPRPRYASNPQQVALCTIPPGAHSCGATTTLDIGGTTTYRGSTSYGTGDHLEFLTDPIGQTYLLVSVLDDSASCSSIGGCTSGHTELFTLPASGSPVQSTISQVFDSGNVLEPDASGFDQVGTTATAFNSIGDPSADAPVYAFDPLTQGASGGVQQLGANGYTPTDVTKLPNGDTAVVGQFEPFSGASAYKPQRVAMRLQPAAGGPFGPWRTIGVTNPVALTFASSGSTYLLGASGFGTYSSPKSPTLQLYEFRGTQLGHPLTIGRWFGVGRPSGTSTDDWQQMPPLSADDAGLVHIAWTARAGDDGCPQLAGHGTATECLLYRQVLPGLVPGPKIVLGESETLLGGSKPFLGTLEGIAANRHSDGWLLFGVAYQSGGPSSANTLGQSLYAVQLPGSASVVKEAKLSGGAAHVTVSCAGGSGCAISARVTGRARTHAVSLGSSSLKLGSGQVKPIAVKLNAAGKHLLSRHHQTLQLTVTQNVGQAPTIVYQKTLTT